MNRDQYAIKAQMRGHRQESQAGLSQDGESGDGGLQNLDGHHSRIDEIIATSREHLIPS